MSTQAVSQWLKGKTTSRNIYEKADQLCAEIEASEAEQAKTAEKAAS